MKDGKAVCAETTRDVSPKVCHVTFAGFLRRSRLHSTLRASNESALEKAVAKERKKQTAKKRKKQNLSGMAFQELMDLRDQVDKAMSGYRSTLEKQLAALGGSVAAFGGKVARGIRGSAMKGRKVAAKYKGPDGELWAGRGATPRWLVAAMKGTGKKREDFLIEKSGAKTATKRRMKK
jgi:DNA-binding protein H-NS